MRQQFTVHFHMSSEFRKCCACWASSFAKFWASSRAVVSGKCKAAFLVATASCFRSAHRWLHWHSRLWLVSPLWASLHRVFTSLWPTMITNLLWDMKFSGGWPSTRLFTNALMAFCRAPKYKRQCSGSTALLGPSTSTWASWEGCGWSSCEVEGENVRQSVSDCHTSSALPQTTLLQRNRYKGSGLLS